ncbi:MAG: UDP-N-acetylglucosamine 2-epimerase (non-hydrolyzing) [Chloroflexi bacterium]|nr:UDP-N-acetylglucosamine 2-epimerase (non-hydrolyzing) [Chloroflexota bacterium]
MLICNVVGARPNFMKIAPIVDELQKRRMPQILVHTGQHYDANMSQVFFDELGLPRPDVDLEIGSDTHARQTARIMMAFEDVCREHRPGLVIVVGDVNSTLAAALVAAKLHIPVAHVEAGLRSFDQSMPEEVNRVVADHLSTLLFVTEQTGVDNLRREGVAAEKIHLVGNCMADTLLKHAAVAVERAPWLDFGLTPGAYALLTLHRPANVDDRDVFEPLLAALSSVTARLPLLFPVHPRTRARLDEWRVPLPANLKLIEPLPYLAFLGLLAKARLVLTDSGGVQQETTMLNVPCLTLRETTELPVTLESGTNRLVGTDAAKIEESVRLILEGAWQTGQRPPLWDGQAGARIVDVLARWSALAGGV